MDNKHFEIVSRHLKSGLFFHWKILQINGNVGTEYDSKSTAYFSEAENNWL